jgi:hypothetical protein
MPQPRFAALLLAGLLAAQLPVLVGCAEDDAGSATQTAGGDGADPPAAPDTPSEGDEPPGTDPAPNPDPAPAQPEPDDRTAPEVVAVHPAAGATKVFLDAQITARFDEALDPASITPDAVVVTNFQGRVAGSLQYDGETIVFTPFDLLIYNTDHAVTVAGVTDAGGNALAEPYHWTFRTGTCRSNFC